MEIGNKIMELRKKNNLSQEELAEKVGAARQTISKWELGETAPDLKQAKKIFSTNGREWVKGIMIIKNNIIIGIFLNTKNRG